MKFSMNGFRRNFSEDMGLLREIVFAVINDNDYDKEDLVDLLNQVITHSNVINCIYDNENPDFSNMSDTNVKRLEHQDA
ncbi:MAG: hypothetical protein JKY81_04630 [Colwellia sp.]|nr:hypothetical protein [Colwellia sp.]